MAEARIRKYADEQFEAQGAGLETKGLNPLTIKVMKGVAIDISKQQSKGVDTYLGKVLVQYLITVCDGANKNCPTVLPEINKRMHWSFQRPSDF